VVGRGGTLYKVSRQSVILMDGPVPAYRDLSGGVADGPDVKELKENLVALGFDSSHQITVNDTFDAATTTAVEAWQASLGETQTGVVSLGDVVFLPGSQRITQVNTVLGSTGGASSGSGSSSTTGASLKLGPAQAEFVSLTTTAATTTTTTSTAAATTSTWTTSSATTTPDCPTASTVASASAVAAQRAASDCPLPNNPDQKSNSQELQLEALIALLKAETAELRQKNSSSASGSSTNGRSGSSSGTGSTSGSGFSGGSGTSARSSAGTGSSASGLSGGSTGSSGSASGASSSGASSGGTAQAILQSTSTQLVVTV